MPANRSRTLQWRRCLNQILDRKGAIEVAISRHFDEHESVRHLLWRVRLLDVSEDEIVVEQPMTLGRVISIDQGVELVAILAVGQNRWMFCTTNLGLTSVQGNGHRSVMAMRLLLPKRVERCQRRSFYRVQTASLIVPEVDLWPLLDPKSVLVAERANELHFEQDREDGDLQFPTTHQHLELDDIMPEVGPRFSAMLVNLGGGGVGVRVRPQDGQAVARHKLFWMRLCLRPDLKTPICATAKLVHTHMEASQDLYAGLAFDFSFNPAHQRFVVEQICRYVSLRQRSQRDEVNQMRKPA